MSHTRNISTGFGLLSPSIYANKLFAKHKYCFFRNTVPASCFIAPMAIANCETVQLILKNKNITHQGNYPIVENKYFPVPFSFFNSIFIHSDNHRQDDPEAILAHEEVQGLFDQIFRE